MRRCVLPTITSVTTNPAFAHADAVPSFRSLQNRLRRRRQECFPPIPRQLNNVNIVGEWALTWNDRRHLSAIDNGWGLALFLTDRNARILFRCDSILVLVIKISPLVGIVHCFRGFWKEQRSGPPPYQLGGLGRAVTTSHPPPQKKKIARILWSCLSTVGGRVPTVPPWLRYSPCK